MTRKQITFYNLENSSNHYCTISRAIVKIKGKCKYIYAVLLYENIYLRILKWRYPNETVDEFEKSVVLKHHDNTTQWVKTCQHCLKRSFLQWIGGMGIIVFTIYILHSLFLIWARLLFVLLHILHVWCCYWYNKSLVVGPEIAIFDSLYVEY